MFEIKQKNLIAPQVWRYSILAPEIAEKRRAGHFIILRPTHDSERIPLTIVDSNIKTGTLDIIFQVVGATTLDLSKLEPGEMVHDVAGPMGKATHIENYGNCVMIGGGVGIAPLLPIAKAFHQAGNTLTSILGSRSKDYLILEEDLQNASHQLIVTTDDGSKGQKSLVTGPLKTLLDQGNVNFVLAVGPVVMMKAVAEMTRPYNIKTMVSLNPLMIDGTGMCGVCRCQVEGKMRFACIDGPEFDGHMVDFDNLNRRLAMYKQEEKEKMEAKQ